MSENAENSDETCASCCGGDPAKLTEGLLAIANGEGLHGKPVRDADRIKAYELLLSYGWGKPPPFAAMTAVDRAGSSRVATGR